MPRRMKAAPLGVMLAKTTRGSWIAFWEEWEGDTLVEIHPMRFEPNGGITQARERREILAEVERTIQETEIRRLRARLKETEDRSAHAAPRYASAG